MVLAHFSMFIHEFFNKYPNIVPEVAPLTILDSMSYVCMVNNCKDTKDTMHIARKLHLVRNGENCKMHKIEWCEGDLQLSDVTTKNVGDNYLNRIMKYIMVILDE